MFGDWLPRRIVLFEFPSGAAFEALYTGETGHGQKAVCDQCSSIYPCYSFERAIQIHFKVHIGNRAFLTHQAFLPEPVNTTVI